MRDEVTSPKRLPPGAGTRIAGRLGGLGPDRLPPRGGDPQGGDVGAGAGVDDAPTGGDAKKIRTRRTRL